MATIFYKFAGDVLTATDASMAETGFVNGGTIPTGYEFKHWSSSSSSDQEVTALNPGGAGVTVTGNATYYPVIGMSVPLSMTLSGSTFTYNVKAAFTRSWTVEPAGGTTHNNEATINIWDNDVSNPWFDNKQLHVIFVQSTIEEVLQEHPGVDYSSTIAQDSSAGNVDFGVITIGGNGSVNAYETQSEYDDATYRLKVERQNQTNAELYFMVYKQVGSSWINVSRNTALFYLEMD